MQDFISIRQRGRSRRIASLLVLGFCLSFFGLFVTRTGRTGGPILTIYTSYDVFLPKDVPFWGFRWYASPFMGSNPPTPPILGAGIGVLQPNCMVKSKNMHIIKTAASIPTKFCTVIKTTKCPSWVVHTRSSQIQNGGRPPSWNRNSSGDEIANVNFYAARPEGTGIR